VHLAGVGNHRHSVRFGQGHDLARLGDAARMSVMRRSLGAEYLLIWP
jgi:hypothetical protein